MRPSTYTLTAALLFLICSGSQAQLAPSDLQRGAAPASYIGVINKLRVVPPLSSRSELDPAIPLTEAPNDGRASKNLVVPGKDPQTEDDHYTRFPHPLAGKIPTRAPSLVFDVNNNVGPPSDPSLAVGLDHTFVVYNTGFIIYDKAGNDLTGPLSTTNIFSSSGCCDLTASYDAAANRWVITLLGSGAEVAVSQGADPVNSAWNLYSVNQISDYQKLSVWSDGYYLTDNTGSNDKVWAMERSAMLAGNATAGLQSFPLPGMVTSGFHSPQMLNVSDSNMPASGGATAIYMQDDAWTGITYDHVKLWTIDVDWATPASSTVSAATELATTPFISVFDGGSFSNLAQPGGGSEIDALQATIMNQAQFRKFGGHNSAVFNFVIDTDASADELAGVRWYELRQPTDNSPWMIEQEGTYTAPGQKHAWHASMIMDSFGNIGMGYTGMAGPNTANPLNYRVSSYYTGRFASDPVGVMSVAEELISAGDGDIPGFRYGDYSKIDIDPANDKEFWFINEYIKNGSGADVVGVFQIASDFDDDVGVVSIDAPIDGALTATEPITVTVFNFGLMAASGFDVAYQIDGGTIVSEPFPGILTSATSAQHTFSATADLSIMGQTYSVKAFTDYTADMYNANDTIEKDVKHIFAVDAGVTAITSPISGSGLTANETFTVKIENYGSATQTSIPVYYIVNGGTPVQETYTGSIAQGASDNYTFTTTVDMSALGTYTLIAGTEIVADSDMSNDDANAVVENTICQPTSDCAGFDDGVTQLQLADQNLQPACGTMPVGYSYEPNIVFNFIMSNNPFSASLEVGYDQSTYGIWIDFNDNNQFEASELIATNLVSTANTNFPFTVDFTTITGVTTGMHLMRVRGGDGNNVLTPCDDMTYGRTNDYTANISGTVGIETDIMDDSQLVIQQMADNHFLLTYNTTGSGEQLPVTVFDVKGQILAYYTLKPVDGVYTKLLNMSYTSSGVYMLKVGDETVNVVKRIVVE